MYSFHQDCCQQFDLASAITTSHESTEKLAFQDFVVEIHEANSCDVQEQRNED